MVKTPDSFFHPSNASHIYDVLPAGFEVTGSELEQVDNVTVISSEGAQTVSAEDFQADLLKVRPRLAAKSLEQTVVSANVRWALADVDAKDTDDDEEFDEDGVKKNSHFEGDFNA